jgi:hypothetical protein
MPWISTRRRTTGVRYVVKAKVDGSERSLATFGDRSDAAAYIDTIADQFPKWGENLRASSPARGRRVAQPVGERILKKVVRAEGGCLQWTGRIDKDGYGRIGVGFTDGGFSRPSLVHREAYAAFVGELTPGLTIDHTCHNTDLTCHAGVHCMHRRCVEPTHLEQVAPIENQKRALAHARHQKSTVEVSS